MLLQYLVYLYDTFPLLIDTVVIDLVKEGDDMKEPAAILVLQYWYTILLIPVFYQYLPVSAILVQILVNTSIPVSSSICNTRRYWPLPKI
jgi:hypothetical protein